MLGTIHLTAFIVSGLLLNLYPGQDTMYIIGRSVSQGRKAGIVSVLGITTGGLVHTLLAGLGLSSILAASGAAFRVITALGALYLLYLGLRILAPAKKEHAAQPYLSGQTLFQIYRQGLLTNLLNPKVALFFLSFLPQFVDPVRNYGPVSFIFLGSIFLATGMTWCLVVALSSAALSGFIKKNGRITAVLGKLTGMLFIGLGLKLIKERVLD